VKAAIRKRLPDVVAIVALVAIALSVAAVILGNQRLTLPGWVPGLGQDFFEIDAELTTAQAVTPGQGQTVNVAGVEVGEISAVRLDDGKAIVTLRLEDFDTVYRDASALLRPKTGLKDMVLELDPGTSAAGRMREGERIPVSQTLPDVNLDEILSALDADTRDYVQLLVGAGAQGLGGNEAALADTIRRFEPTARDLRRISELQAKRRRNIKRVVHNLSLLLDELGGRDAQLAQFVESSNQVFGAFARQDASLRAALAELPDALRETEDALGETQELASELGPTLQQLRPGARALAPSLRAARPFLHQTTPIIRDQLRPFTRVARPTVAALRPALRDLAGAAPSLTASFEWLDEAVNTLAYNPPGKGEEGYLFWLSWANHLGNALFAASDAHGPIRRGIIIVNCASLGVLDRVAANNPQLGTLVGLLNAPRRSEVCTP
jgi:phospholipid/cholesterol/gamma-HCH transport system substrate-binding protein